MPDQEQLEEILIAQIDTLIQNLERIRTVLNVMVAEQIKPAALFPSNTADTIQGKFNRKITGQKTKLEEIKRKLMVQGYSQETLAGAWNDFAAIKEEANLIFNLCLDFLGGMAVRRWELEDGICALAEKMLERFASDIGIGWQSVLILGDERPFDDIIKLTAIIRLRFPEWDIWSLPFIGYEFGQLAARQDLSASLENYFEDKKEKIKQLITHSDIPESELSRQPRSVIEMREGYQNNVRTKEDVDRYIEQQIIHLRNLFADIFATYFMGPAYVYSRTYLRLMPTDVWKDQTYKVAMGRRLAVMKSTLMEMNKASKENRFSPDIYAGVIDHLTEIWKRTIQAFQTDFNGEFTFNDPYDDWFTEAYKILDEEFSDKKFMPQHWNQANELSKSLLEHPTINPTTKISVILNAAWIGRMLHPNRVGDLARIAQKLLDELVNQSASAVTERPPQPTGGRDLTIGR